MAVISKVDYLKIKTLNENEPTFCADCDKYQADIDYNGNHYSLYGYQINGKSANDILKDLDVKVNAFYRTINSNNKEIYFDEILLTIAELIFRLRIDLGVK